MFPAVPKSIYLSSSLGATFYKDSYGKRQQNTLNANPLNMDTLGSPGNETITYNGFVHGHWGKNSPYVWTSGNPVGSGLYQPANIQQQPVTYTPAKFGSRASVALKVTDSNGGAAVPDGVGNVNFHKAVNLKPNPNKNIPQPDQPNAATAAPDWQVWTVHSNPLEKEDDEEVTFSDKTSYDYKASFGAEGTLGVDAKLFNAEFKATIGFDISVATDQAVEQKIKLVWPAHKKTTVYWAYGAVAYTGSLDYYNVQGYKGSHSYSVRIPNIVGGARVVEYYEDSVPLP